MVKRFFSIAAAVCLLVLSAAVASAHEPRDVHEYNFVVGFIQEPAFEGLLNAVSVRITKVTESEGHEHTHGEDEEHKADEISMAAHEHGGEPVEGLEATLRVEVTHVGSGSRREMPLSPVRDDAGHYTAYFVPTATGQYTFRFIGSIEEQAVDEIFESGPGRFADIETADGIQFPEGSASVRELESALRGALESTADAQSQTAAVRTMAIVGIVIGIVGVAIGGVSVAMAMRRR